MTFSLAVLAVTQIHLLSAFTCKKFPIHICGVRLVFESLLGPLTFSLLVCCWCGWVLKGSEYLLFNDLWQAELFLVQAVEYSAVVHLSSKCSSMGKHAACGKTVDVMIVS